MSLKCACGCGRNLTDKEMYFLKDGSLNTLSNVCKKIGQGLDMTETLNDMRKELYEMGYTDEWLGGLDKF